MSIHFKFPPWFATLACMQTRSLSFALVLAGSTLLAQSFTPVREQKNLSPAAIEKLHILETLNSLPAGEWRFHAGDLTHGESVALDASAWPAVSAPSDRKSTRLNSSHA